MLTLTVFLTQAAPEGRLFGLDNQTVIQIAIQLFNAIVLAVALSVILYKPAKEFLRKRSDGIQSKINEAETAAAKANELIAEYERKLKAIDQEREKILEEARVKAYEESKQMLAEARQEASEIKKRAMESMAEEKKRLKEEARLYIIEVAAEMAKKYLAEAIDDAVQERIFEETIAQLEEAQWRN
ncbi:MAG: ATP synthase F0 subunit B [Limnochordia bacterium]